MGMRSSAISVFSDVRDLQAALSIAARADLVLAQGGRFYARLTRVELPQIAVWHVEETLPRIAFIENQTDNVLLAFSASRDTPMVWAGIELNVDTMISI